MTRSPRILFFENNAAYFLSHRLPVARAAQNLGYEVHVATIPDAAADNIRTAGFEFHPLTFSRGGANPFKEWQTLRRIRRLYSELQPALVYQVTVKPVIYGTLAARRLRVPAVVSVISGLGYFASQAGWRGRLLRRLGFAFYRIALRHPNQKVIFHNGDDRDTFVRSRILRQGDTAVMPGSGVDVEHFLATPEPEGTTLVVLVARMLRDKGINEYVTAAGLLRSQDVPARFLLAGDTDRGNPSAITESQLQRWRVGGNVEWLGHVSDMRALYASCHIVCLPSYREGMPRVLLEAAASGRPAVATDVPGCRDAVLPGESGLLVPPRDAEKLAAALRTLIRDPGMRQRMGQQGRRMAEVRFSSHQVVADTVRMIRALMARPI